MIPSSRADRREQFAETGCTRPWAILALSTNRLQRGGEVLRVASARRGPGDWPLAGKITALSVGACAIVALVLAILAYRLSVAGLNEQAQRALTSDSLLVTQAADRWNLERLTDLQQVADTAA